MWGDNYRELAETTVPVMQHYCQKHGYGFHEILLGDNGNDYAFKKHEAFKELFTHDIDAILYLDVDCMITNVNTKVEDFIDEEHSFFITRDFNELNGGALIVKNDYYSVIFNEWVWQSRNDFENEQNAINFFIDKNLPTWVKILPHPSINSYQYSLYPECTSHVGKPELGDWFEGAFILHVPALPLEKRIEILSNVKITE